MNSSEDEIRGSCHFYYKIGVQTGLCEQGRYSDWKISCLTVTNQVQSLQIASYPTSWMVRRQSSGTIWRILTTFSLVPALEGQPEQDVSSIDISPLWNAKTTQALEFFQQHHPCRLFLTFKEFRVNFCEQESTLYDQTLFTRINLCKNNEHTKQKLLQIHKGWSNQNARC